MSNLTDEMLKLAKSNEGAAVLSASQALEYFALRYAENHLNDTKILTITRDKLGELLDWFLT